jgi:hypothetical protein
MIELFFWSLLNFLGFDKASSENSKNWKYCLNVEGKNSEVLNSKADVIVKSVAIINLFKWNSRGEKSFEKKNFHLIFEV